MELKQEEKKMNEKITSIRNLLIKGRMNEINSLVKQCLDEKEDPQTILNDGLLAGMDDIAKKWAAGQAFIPEVLIGARCMNSAIDILEPYLVKAEDKAKCKVVFGTVKGDMHDIGKKLCTLMLKSKDIEVIDIGVDVDANTFADAIEQYQPDVVCMSSLLTTSMPYFETVLETLKERNLRDKVKVAIGGAPVTQAYCDQIGADLFTEDAVSLADALDQMFS